MIDSTIHAREGKRKTFDRRRIGFGCLMLICATLIFSTCTHKTVSLGKVRESRIDVSSCREVVREKRPLYDRDAFVLMQEAYRKAVNPNEWSVSDEHVQGFHVPIEVRYIPGKGRGVVSKEAIPRGTLVWTGEQVAEFPDGEASFLRFLSHLPFDVACDIMQWAYVYSDHGKLIAAVDLDEGALINNARGGPRNIAARKGGLRATRDIEAGEELLTEYSDFVRGGDDHWFNQLWDVAFDSGDSSDSNDLAQDDAHAKDVEQDEVSKHK